MIEPNNLGRRLSVYYLVGAVVVCILLLSIAVYFKGTIKYQQIAPFSTYNVQRVLLHPNFDLTKAELQSLLKHTPQTNQKLILAQSGLFLSLVAQVLQVDPYLSKLVDKEHTLAASYEPNDLVDLDQYPELFLTRRGLRLRSIVLPKLLKMVQAAKIAKIQLPISSTYRSYAYQKSVFGRYSKINGELAANRFSAKAGQSQHQLGLVIDFGNIEHSFAKTKAGKWLSQHAYKYGFSLSYPQGREDFTGYIYEPWHYRYVGTVITELEQFFFDGEQQSFFIFWYNYASKFQKYFHKDNLAS